MVASPVGLLIVELRQEGQRLCLNMQIVESKDMTKDWAGARARAMISAEAKAIGRNKGKSEGEGQGHKYGKGEG